MKRRFTYSYLLPLFVLILWTSACSGDGSKSSKTVASEPKASQVPNLEKAVKVKVYEALPDDEQETPTKESKEKENEDNVATQTQPAANKITPKKKKRKKPTSVKKKPAPRKYAQATFEQKVYNFDTITSGDIIDHSFIFTNTGSLPLEILEADVSCGCTTPVVPFLDILPGEKNKIALSYNSVNKEGDQNPTLVVTTNGNPKKITLSLRGYVKPKKEEKEE